MTANCRCVNTSANSRNYAIIIFDAEEDPTIYWTPLSHADWCSLRFELTRHLQLNSAGLPKSTIVYLQCVQNAAVRRVCGLGPCDHVTKSLRELHWLPIRFRIVYKLCLMMHNVHTRCSPGYIKETLTPTAGQPNRVRQPAPTMNYPPFTTRLEGNIFRMPALPHGTVYQMN